MVRKLFEHTNASIVDQNGRIAVRISNGSAEIDEIGEVGDVALVIVHIWD